MHDAGLSRGKKGWVAASQCSLREAQQGCWEPQVSQEHACLYPACAQVPARSRP